MVRASCLHFACRFWPRSFLSPLSLCSHPNPSVPTPEPTLRHIAFVTGNFPSRAHPNHGTFVRQLVDAIAQQGVQCTVIHPRKLHTWWRERREDPTAGAGVGPGVRVHRPVTLSVSNRQLGPFNTFAVTHYAFQRAAWRVLNRLPAKPDAVYGHFLYSAGATAVWAAQRLGRPGFVAVGESFDEGEDGLWTLRMFSGHRVRGDFAKTLGFVAVSTFLRDQLIKELGIEPSRIVVFPNGVDCRRFYPRDRLAMRRKYGLPEARFLVVFVGGFEERKGVQRVCAALEGLPEVGGIFVGDGRLRPVGPQVCFCGRVAHELVPELLSAADAFVLPSRAEGSSNATLEAMACGLPVVVSDRAFNRDICNATTALLVAPDDVKRIRAAVSALVNSSELRAGLAGAALSAARGFGIQERAHGILRWMAARATGSHGADAIK